MNLTELVQRVDAKEFSLDKAHELLAPYTLTPKLVEYLDEVPGGAYYRKLPLLVEELGANRVLELGCCTGLSAVMMSFARNQPQIDSYDISHDRLHEPFLSSGVNFLLTHELGYRELEYYPYDLIFCDVGAHESKHESWIHYHLNDISWRGICVYDDIEWVLMRPFWESIINCKLKTYYHGESGFGLVNY